MDTIILSFQIRVPFIGLRGRILVNLYWKMFRFQLPNVLSSRNMKISVPKAKSLTKQTLPYLKNTLTGPGSFLPYYLRSFHYQGPPSVLIQDYPRQWARSTWRSNSLSYVYLVGKQKNASTLWFYNQNKNKQKYIWHEVSMNRCLMYFSFHPSGEPCKLTLWRGRQLLWPSRVWSKSFDWIPSIVLTEVTVYIDDASIDDWSSMLA